MSARQIDEDEMQAFMGGSIEPVTIEVWSMALIGYLSVATPTGLMYVDDFLPQIIEEVTADASGQYAILRRSLERGQVVPLFISKDGLRLRDGIHRVALASVLDWPAMLVSTTKMVYKQWDQAAEGRKYHELWNYRLNGLKDVR